MSGREEEEGEWGEEGVGGKEQRREGGRKGCSRYPPGNVLQIICTCLNVVLRRSCTELGFGRQFNTPPTSPCL